MVRGSWRREIAALAAVLSGALALRAPSVGWGLPPSIPEAAASGIRCSYAFDEDDLLTNISFTKPSEFDFDPRLYQWGTFHLHLTLLAMEAAERTGYIGRGWRDAYHQMIPGAFERVYRAGRWLSILAGLAAVALAYGLGREFAGPEAGLWTALLVAASPAHLLASVQIRTDLTMMAMLTLAAWLGLKAQKTGKPTWFLWMGFAGGLAVTAKYPAAFAVIPIAAAALAPQRFRPRLAAALLAGGLAGCLLGQPYLFIKPAAMLGRIFQVVGETRHFPAEFRISAAALIATQALYAARFLVGPLAFGLALAGLGGMARRRLAADWLILAAAAGAALSLVPLLWPLLRYQLALLPFLALGFAVFLCGLPARWRAALGAVAVAFPVAGSIAQLHYMRTAHPGNRAMDLVLRTVPPGTSISRLTAEMPPLDRKVYPMGPNPFLDDMEADPPSWVLTADLPDRPYPAATLQLLRSRYQRTADFSTPRILAWATLGETGAPHDWKYTHPRMTLYRRAP